MLECYQSNDYPKTTDYQKGCYPGANVCQITLREGFKPNRRCFTDMNSVPSVLGCKHKAGLINCICDTDGCNKDVKTAEDSAAELIETESTTTAKTTPTEQTSMKQNILSSNTNKKTKQKNKNKKNKNKKRNRKKKNGNRRRN